MRLVEAQNLQIIGHLPATDDTFMSLASRFGQEFDEMLDPLPQTSCLRLAEICLF